MELNWTEFWDKSYWLPRRDTWDDVPTRIPELWTAVYLALPIILFRFFVESIVGLQLGRWAGYVQEPLLLAAKRHVLGGFCHQTKRKKVLECFYRFTAYTLLFALGCYVLMDKEWLYNNQACYIEYPRRPVENDVWWYYMLETGFYVSLLLSSVFDVRRSDFWEMTFHHLVTIGLLTFSWTVNFVRVGTLILISHDVNDIFLELAKLIRYRRKFTLLANTVFVIFLLSWIATRLIFLPVVVVWGGIRDGPALIQPDYEVFDLTQKPYAPRVLLLLLVCLMALHVFWTVLIVKIVIRALSSGEAGDVRSDSEETDTEDAKQANGGEKKKLLRKRKDLDRQREKAHED